jgi:hypothetical protein
MVTFADRARPRDASGHVILSPPPRHEKKQPTHPRIAEWQLVAWLGAAFTAVGVMDIALAWFPTRFSSAEWEFGTTTLTLNALPVPTLGLALLLAAGLAQKSPRLVRSTAIGFALLALMVLAVGFLFATVLPIALRANPGSIAQETVRKAAVKAFIQIAIYVAFATYATVTAWRELR